MFREDYERVLSRLTPDDALKDRILSRMEEQEMQRKEVLEKITKKSTRKGVKRAIAIAACATFACVGSVFAAGNIISYFQSDKAIELTDMVSLAAYNEEVGASGSNFGYTMTIDNLATDDNFMHVFYTLKKDDNTAMSEEEYYRFLLLCRINGKLANLGNHNEEEGYIAQDGSYKGVMKLNVAAMDVPDTFKLEMYTENELKQDSKFEQGYLYQDDLALTDEDISKLLYVSTSAKKADVTAASVIKNIDKTIELNYFDDNDQLQKGEAKIEKVVFSPFGNQLVVTDNCEGFGAMKLSAYAFFDENRQSLDVLNTCLNGARAGEKSVNSLEFLKADVNTKALRLVPLKDEAPDVDEEKIVQKIGTYPMRIKTSELGSIVVTDVRVADGRVEIDYYKDGFYLYDPEFSLLDKDGNDVNLGGKLGCMLRTRVNHSTNSYTAQYIYDNYDENGKPIPMPESMNKENLEKSLAALGIYGHGGYALDYENAIDIKLK